jgi:hypothetical protein
MVHFQPGAAFQPWPFGVKAPRSADSGMAMRKYVGNSSRFIRTLKPNAWDKSQSNQLTTLRFACRIEFAFRINFNAGGMQCVQSGNDNRQPLLREVRRDNRS